MEKAVEALTKVLNIIKDNGFGLYIYEEDGKECGIEIESWTPGGVNMIHFLDFRYPNRSILNLYDIADEITRTYDRFDVDAEIEIHREDPSYKQDFSYKESVKDFEDWEQTLKDLSEEVGALVSEMDLSEDFENIDITMSELI